MAYDFHYIRSSTGELSGLSLATQTELALSEIGTQSETGVEAYALAESATTLANNAQSAADAAQTTAEEALATAKSAQETGNSATDSAAEALAAAQTAQESADTAQETADSKADIYHASTETTYGLGSDTLYGHVMLSDETTSDSGVDSGIAATPYAVAQVMSAATAAQESADNAQSAADAAQSSADAAQSSADTAQETAAEALETANNALETANAIQTSTDSAQSTAESALSLAQSNATTISNNYSTLTGLIGSIRTATTYETTETDDDTEETTTTIAIDADEMTSTGLYYVDSSQDNSNLPSDNDGYLEVYDDTEDAYIMQTFTDSTGVMYTRTAIISEEETTDDDGETVTEDVYTWGEWQSGGSGNVSAARYEITIPADGWEYGADTDCPTYYALDLDLDYVTTDAVPLLSIHPAYLDIASDCSLSPSIQSLDGILRLYATSTPSEDMTADLTLLAVSEGDTSGSTDSTSTDYDIATDAEVDEMLSDVFG